MKKRQKKKKKNNVLLLLAPLLLFAAGAGIFLYPAVSNMLAERNQQNVIRTYQATVDELDQAAIDAAWQEAVEYNENLAGDPVHDPFVMGSGYVLPDNYEEVLNISGDGVMGYVEIPKINVYLPIYHGTGEDVLEKGAGHLEMTALPIGGENRHPVISAHRGLPSAELFTRLDEMETGDQFYIHVLDRTLAYEVDQIEVIEPEELSLLQPEEDKDLVTLLTCTPYAVNTHRAARAGDPDSLYRRPGRRRRNCAGRGKYVAYRISGCDPDGYRSIVSYPGWCGRAQKTRKAAQETAGKKGRRKVMRRSEKLRRSQIARAGRRREAERKAGRGRKLLLVFAVLLFAAGAGLMLVPFAEEFISARKGERQIAVFREREYGNGETDAAGPEEGGSEEEGDEKSSHSELLEQMQEYNRKIYENGQQDLKDAWSYEQTVFEFTDTGLDEEMIGYITIPAMDLELPLYIGADEENLSKGAAVLGQTSMPIGGSDTNCVIAAHRGGRRCAYVPGDREP